MFTKPFQPVTFTEENIDSMISQLSICENYCKTTRIYLEMIKTNLVLWNNMYIFSDTKQ